MLSFQEEVRSKRKEEEQKKKRRLQTKNGFARYLVETNIHAHVSMQERTQRMSTEHDELTFDELRVLERIHSPRMLLHKNLIC